MFKSIVVSLSQRDKQSKKYCLDCLSLEDKGTMILQNIGKHARNDTASHDGRLEILQISSVLNTRDHISKLYKITIKIPIIKQQLCSTLLLICKVLGLNCSTATSHPNYSFRVFSYKKEMLGFCLKIWQRHLLSTALLGSFKR